MAVKAYFLRIPTMSTIETTKPLKSQNLIVIEVKWLGATNHRGSRIRLKNTFTEKKVILPNDDTFDRMADQAIDYLKQHNITCIGSSKESDQGIVLIVLSWDEKDKLQLLDLMF